MVCPRTLSGEGEGEGAGGKVEVRNPVAAGVLRDFGPGEPERSWFR